MVLADILEYLIPESTTTLGGPWFGLHMHLDVWTMEDAVGDSALLYASNVQHVMISYYRTAVTQHT